MGHCWWRNDDRSTVVIEVLKLPTEMSHCFWDTQRAFAIRSWMGTARVHGVDLFLVSYVRIHVNFISLSLLLIEFWLHQRLRKRHLPTWCPTSLLQTAKATDTETLRRDSHIHLFRSRWALWHGRAPYGKKFPVTCVFQILWSASCWIQTQFQTHVEHSKHWQRHTISFACLR